MNKIQITTVSEVAARTSTVTTTGVDVRGMTGRLIGRQQVGTVSGTTPTLNGKWQQSADNSTDWTDISGATHAEVTAANNGSNAEFDVRDTRGYVRYVGTIAGTSPSFTMGVLLVNTPTRS